MVGEGLFCIVSVFVWFMIWILGDGDLDLEGFLVEEKFLGF